MRSLIVLVACVVVVFVAPVVAVAVALPLQRIVRTDTFDSRAWYFGAPLRGDHGRPILRCFFSNGTSGLSITYSRYKRTVRGDGESVRAALSRKWRRSDVSAGFPLAVRATFDGETLTRFDLRNRGEDWTDALPSVTSTGIY